MELRQRTLGQRWTFRLTDDKIVVRARSLRGESESRFLYSHLDPDPSRIRSRGLGSWLFFSIALLLFLFCLVVGVGAWVQDKGFSEVSQTSLVWAGIMCVCTIITLIKALNVTYHLVIFHGRDGTIAIRLNKPSRDAFTEFVGELVTRIESSLNRDALIARAVLSRLGAEDILDEWSLRRAARVLGLDDPSDAKSSEDGDAAH